MGGPCQFAEYEVPFAARSKRALYYGTKNVRVGAQDHITSSHLNINIAMNQNSEIGIVLISHERFTQTTYKDGLKGVDIRLCISSAANHIPLNPTPSLLLDVPEPSVIMPSLPSQAADFVVFATTSAMLSVDSRISKTCPQPKKSRLAVASMKNRLLC